MKRPVTLLDLYLHEADQETDRIEKEKEPMNRRNLITSTIAAIAALPVFGTRATEAEEINPDDYCAGCGAYWDVGGSMLYLGKEPWGPWICPTCEETYDQPVDDLTALYHEHFGFGVPALPNNGNTVYPVSSGHIINTLEPLPPVNAMVTGYQMYGTDVLDNTVYPVVTTPLGDWINRAGFADSVEQVRVYWF